MKKRLQAASARRQLGRVLHPKAIEELRVLHRVETHDIPLATNSEPLPATAPAAQSTMSVSIEKYRGSAACSQQDLLAVEEPLQIRIAYQTGGTRTEKDISITMRTPGHDAELAAGFLFSEGVLQSSNQILRIRQSCGIGSKSKDCNRVVLELSPEAKFDPQRLERHFYVSSSCGVCGKASIESLRAHIGSGLLPLHPCLDSAMIHRLPETLRNFQSVFQKTGGLHAAALLDFSGNLLSVREDVGRHNAVDKLIGAEFLRASLPLHENILLLSGRASFELVQKALMAGIPIIVAVGAPSSLAVEMALRYKMTLVGFVRGDQFNVYSGASRFHRTPHQVGLE